MTQTQALPARVQALLDAPDALCEALRAAMAQYPGLTAQGRNGLGVTLLNETRRRGPTGIPVGQDAHPLLPGSDGTRTPPVACGRGRGDAAGGRGGNRSAETPGVPADSHQPLPQPRCRGKGRPGRRTRGTRLLRPW